MATLPAADKAVQQGLARPGHPPALVAVVAVLVVAEHGRDGRLAPDDVAEAVLAGQQQLVIVEETYHLASSLDLEEGEKDQFEPALHLLVGMLEDAAQRVPHQPDRQR